MKFKDFMKSGKYLKMQIGDSGVYELACDPFALESKPNRFGNDSLEVKLIDVETGEEKIFNVKSAGVANQLSKFEEGDEIKIKKVDSDDGKGRWKITEADGTSRNDDDEDVPKKKKKKVVVEDDDEDDDEEEEETPKKKKKKKVVEEDDEDEDEDDEEEEETPKKKKKKKSDEVDVDDIDF